MKSRIVLLQRHTHGGRLCTPGEVIEVDPELADWLIVAGIARTADIPEIESIPLPSKEKRK